MKTITIGYSPCPNDTFIFDALIHNRIDTGNFLFEPTLADVEQLNKWAFQEELSVTKLSVGAFPGVSKNYIILDSGGALGEGVGPLLVSKYPIPEKDFPSIKVVIPGKSTTANLLLTLFLPQIKNKTEAVFSEIASLVLTGEYDAGLLIHEGRFTYSKQGLIKLLDLGELWEHKVKVPLPLGCIAASRKLSKEERDEINRLIRNSLEYAIKNPAAGKDYIRVHAQEMDTEVIESHIKLYVNDFSLNLGPEGRAAIAFMLSEGKRMGLLPESVQPVFNTESI